MPIADMTGAAANRISVARDLGRYNQGQKDQLLSGISAAGDIGASAIEAQHRAKMEQMLQEQGFDPATAKQLIAAGPHAAASALLQKKRDAQQREQQLSDVADTRMYEQGQQDRQNAFQMGLRTTPTYGETQADDQRKAFQEALKSSSAPKPFNLIGGPIEGATGSGITMPPSGSDIARNMAQRGFSYNPPSELTPPKEPTLDPSVVDRNRADAEEARARAEALRTPKPTKPEPYKPITREEQIQFDADKAAATRAEPRDPNANVDAVERLKRRMSVDDQTEFERLFNGAKQGPFGTAPTAESVNAFKEFVGAMMTKYPEAAPRQIGGGGGRAPVATGAVDSALKSEFDAFPPERQKALLEKMSPEERAKVGR